MIDHALLPACLRLDDPETRQRACGALIVLAIEAVDYQKRLRPDDPGCGARPTDPEIVEAAQREFLCDGRLNSAFVRRLWDIVVRADRRSRLAALLEERHRLFETAAAEAKAAAAAAVGRCS